ncbi:DNA polymerase III subunit epsilon [Candidatus Thiomargarita nelsonii]|uniref:DNA polymerase III subunit epsilon n=1 Tax=Candidatus Thiomargarita nelsonii TaxID=1003181 RepID=A0A0A6PI47_9GAMM|nr:DNA polymerase III subunit epsilon [Candidatus Thiomargarita nelsonii]
MRQITLDTETTGLSPTGGHRIIEIGCIEILNRQITDKRYQEYLQPDRQIDAGAITVHGITNDFLQDKPRFADIVEEFIAFIEGAELIIHNAKFDVGFINNELKLLNKGWQPLEHYCPKIIDTLSIARDHHPGQKINLDALCKRYNVDNSNRQLHGALLDAEILAEVYLTMTGGQVSLLALDDKVKTQKTTIKRISSERARLTVLAPTEDELQHHAQRLAAIDKASGGKCLWQELNQCH